MLLSQAAESYVADRQIARTPIYSAVRFCSIIGDMPVEQISQQDIDKFKDAAPEKGWSPWTIKGTVRDVRTLTRHFCGFSPSIRIKVERPEPEPTPLESIDAVWESLDDWMKQWIAMSYWFCLRLDDSVRMQLALVDGQGWSESAGVMYWQAHKTGKKHRMPVPDWLKKWLKPQKLPYRRVADWTQDLIRKALAEASDHACIEQVYPRNVRQRGLTEWKRASPDAGSIVHGSGLGILDHYVSAVEILESVMFRVRLPKCFGAIDGAQAPEAELLNSFRRLDPQAKDLVVMTAQRMAK